MTQNRSVIVLTLLLAATASSCGGFDDLAPASDIAAHPRGSAVASGSVTQPDRTTPIDTLLLLGGRIHTMDAVESVADALAVGSDGRILAVGTEAEARAAAGPNAIVIDLGGKTVLPGFQDPHVHVPEAGLNDSLCILDPGLSLKEYADVAADCAEEQADQPWVRGAGASLSELDPADGSPLAALDRAIPDRPAIILDDVGHAAWANSLALEAAGIALDDKDPPGGLYGRDPASSAVNGILLENAQHRVRDAAAETPRQIDDGLRLSLAQLAQNGVTSISDAGGYWTRGYTDAWDRALAAGRLTVRAANALYVFPDRPFEEQMVALKARFSDDPSSLLRFNTAKIYVDGILDLGTAALLEPYDEPLNALLPMGFRYFEQGDLERYVAALSAIGFQINFHVIGDAATRAALDAVEAEQAADPASADRRHRLTHAYLIDEDDLARFAELGVTVDFQMAPESISADYADSIRPIIGARADRLIPLTEAVDAGARVVLSSDWDADPLSPLGTIERALTRPTHAISDVAAAVRMVTSDVALLLGQAERCGSLEAGKFADLVVLDKDIFGVDTKKIDETRVLLTMLGGREVYRAKAYPRVTSPDR